MLAGVWDCVRVAEVGVGVGFRVRVTVGAGVRVGGVR